MGANVRPGDVHMVLCSDGNYRKAFCVDSISGLVWVFSDNTRRMVSQSESRFLAFQGEVLAEDVQLLRTGARSSRHRGRDRAAEYLFALAKQVEDEFHLAEDDKPELIEGEYVHCVMYRDHQMGTLCDSGAWGTPVLFTAVTENATCPGCRKKLDGGGR